VWKRGVIVSLIFARRLKQERELKGLTQVQMAEKLGINPGTLSGYERDYREPDFSISMKIAKILNVDLDYLVGLTDRKNPPEITYRPSELVRIPVLGTIRAGYDLYAEQHVIGYELISEKIVNDGDYFYLVVT
jgi:transcriptional regulator with XRE-family HTH domain